MSLGKISPGGTQFVDVAHSAADAERWRGAVDLGQC